LRKYISVLLCCFLMAVILIPGTYSLWRKDLNVIGTVEISADKKGPCHGPGNQVFKDTYLLEYSEGESITGEADVEEHEDAKGTENADEAEEEDTIEAETEEKVEEAEKVKEN